MKTGTSIQMTKSQGNFRPMNQLMRISISNIGIEAGSRESAEFPSDTSEKIFRKIQQPEGIRQLSEGVILQRLHCIE